MDSRTCGGLRSSEGPGPDLIMEGGGEILSIISSTALSGRKTSQCTDTLILTCITSVIGGFHLAPESGW